MDVFEIRKINLGALLKDADSDAAFGRAVDINPAYISHLMSDNVPARMGNKTARKIEAALGLEHGWMDVQHTPSVGIEEFLGGLDERTRDFVETAMLLYKANPEYGRRKIREWLADVISKGSH